MEDVEDKVACLGSLTVDAHEGPWMTKIKMDHCSIVCKTDTDAAIMPVLETRRNATGCKGEIHSHI